jgi:hypothetical protein
MALPHLYDCVLYARTVVLFDLDSILGLSGPNLRIQFESSRWLGSAAGCKYAERLAATGKIPTS